MALPLWCKWFGFDAMHTDFHMFAISLFHFIYNILFAESAKRARIVWHIIFYFSLSFWVNVCVCLSFVLRIFGLLAWNLWCGHFEMNIVYMCDHAICETIYILDIILRVCGCWECISKTFIRIVFSPIYIHNNHKTTSYIQSNIIQPIWFIVFEVLCRLPLLLHLHCIFRQSKITLKTMNQNYCFFFCVIFSSFFSHRPWMSECMLICCFTHFENSDAIEYCQNVPGQHT